MCKSTTIIQVTLEAQLGLIGGTMGLLTGFSILSTVEIVYFLIRFSISILYLSFGAVVFSGFSCPSKFVELLLSTKDLEGGNRKPPKFAVQTHNAL